MFDPLIAARRAYLTEASRALKEAGEALTGLADLEEASPVGKRGAWNYPLFLLSTAVEALTEVAASLVPPGKGGSA